MLESRSYYFPDENPAPAKGWVAFVPDEHGCNRGCTGFDTKAEAQEWMDRCLEDTKKHFKIDESKVKVFKR